MEPKRRSVASCAWPCGFDVSSCRVSMLLRELAVKVEPVDTASRVGAVLLASLGAISLATLLRAMDLTWNLVREEVEDAMLERKEVTLLVHKAAEEAEKLEQEAAMKLRE